MSYAIWSVSPAVMRHEKLVESEKLIWHYFWNQCGRRAGPLTVFPDQCARELGLSQGMVYSAATTLADVGLLMPIEEPDGIPSTGVAPPDEELYAEGESHWLRWKVPSAVLSRNDLASGPKLAYLYIWNKAGARPGRMTMDVNEIAAFFNVPESSI